MDFETRLQAFTQKLTEMVKKEGKSHPSQLGLGEWLLHNMSKKDMDFLGEIEEHMGEEKANRWLTQVLVSSGLYKSDDGVYVQPL